MPTHEQLAYLFLVLSGVMLILAWWFNPTAETESGNHFWLMVLIGGLSSTVFMWELYQTTHSTIGTWQAIETILLGGIIGFVAFIALAFAISVAMPSRLLRR